VRQAAVPVYGQQPPWQPAVGHVAGEVRVDALEALGVQADLGRVDLDRELAHLITVLPGLSR
jgi:hypothetical protein